ncbi:tail fiber domain-containing protein [Chitinophaga sp. sic0106]|uniref:tail fiber domain-containing protein n=1 Tax=Chitinophaga sp. sic0106 TaxID=2854785 RepID=UPI001C46E92B|nr:tail fiber domain-containing protein [Chitinophaga sp. sic0106]MBV7533919.1 tail fiber domain-containing protein [Chitinophaga sp. sic0106]
MKKSILLLFLFAASSSYAQKVYQIRADSVRIYNVCDTAELILENRTSGVNGYLYNKGNGRTEFKKIKLEQIGTSQIAIVGQDTLDLSTMPGIGGVQSIYREGDQIKYVKNGIIYTIDAPMAPTLENVTASGNMTHNKVLVDGNFVYSPPSISLAIGDHDSGIRSDGDGVLSLMANSRMVARWTQENFNFFYPPLVDGNKIWHEGNDGVNSGMDADLLRGLAPVYAPYINSIVARDGYGDAFARYFNTSAPTENGINLTRIFAGNDGYIRPVDATAVRKFLGVPVDGETLASVTGREATTDVPIMVKNKISSSRASVLDDTLYARGNFEAQSNGYPSYGFHRPGISGMALYMWDDGQLRVRSDIGMDGKLWHSENDGVNSGLDADLLRGLYPDVLGKANTLALRDLNGNLMFVNNGIASAGLYWGNNTDSWRIFIESEYDTPSGNMVFENADNGDEGWLFRNNSSAGAGVKDVLKLNRDKLNFGGVFDVDGAGNTTASGNMYATSYYQTSLRSLKKNITPLSYSALAILNKAQVRTFQFKADTTGKTNIGFIADEVPDEMSTPGRKGVDQASTVGLLVKSVQELAQQNEALVEKVKQLEAMIEKLVADKK